MTEPNEKLAARAGAIEPFRVMELSARASEHARAGHEVVQFQVGEPDFVTAEPIVRAGQAALAAGHTRYTNADGLPELREAIAADYRARRGVDVAADAIIVTPGASGALTLLLAALFEPGDELYMADPGYPCNAAFTRLVNAEPRFIATGPQTQYQPTADQLAAAWTAAGRGLLLASPANPTGGMLGATALRELAAFVHRRDGVVLLDEIYADLTFEGGHDRYQCGWQVDQRIVLVNSFSKFFGMTGWRLGWIVAPPWLRDALRRIGQNLFIAPSSIAQHAALAAFSAPAMEEHERRREIYRRRRDLLASGLSQLGFQVPFRPGGGFFLWVDISHTGMDAETFCWRLLDEFKVAVTPGTDFASPASGAGSHVRFAYTTSETQIELGLERLRHALASW
ncbi:MAG: aminotransferase class I/II-fold pyridoxal phosphate-dependent enzyme [Pseudomonadota bacterium]